ncbi:ABC transporter ATP-binding protein [Caloranaerobacter sp. TR13]|uniref:ribosomal protection-like ABC-F family protein n=1 Tax=Caloranaerobacter sp. TR13 TaxID=1302151 RepID=UPI0006D44ACB|nr:ABC-F type ribosomal protection protein [Caloranaerobacter sp. TR13]KPU27144.1 ABC transporter ATP-binding protein [Caloranaerobacter sp. TR13]
MIELSLNDVEKYYGANKILKKISFEVKTGERVGVVGSNGAGKTTIFKIIAGIGNYENGIISIRKGATIGYLDQIPVYPCEYKVIDVLNTAFEELFKIRRDMKKLEEKMNIMKGEELDKVIKRYGQLQSLFEYKGGYDIEEKLNKICTGLKIKEDFRERKFSTLSGGEKTTVLLGKILLQNPDILLLDEPSNHLDIESIEWLESFLNEYSGTVLIISHDRYFLDRVVNKIIEIEAGEAKMFYGNYSYYVKEKERQLLETYQAYKNQQKKIKDMEEAIKRFRDWGYRADNADMFKKAKNMEKRLERMEKIEKPILEKQKIQLNFSISNRSGKDVIIIKELSKSFGNNIIFKKLNLHVRYGEKLGILGKNGSGKSTLIKILLNQYIPDQGEVIIGSGVKIGYLEQDIIFDNEDSTILEVFRDYFPMPEDKARRILAKFLFYSEDIFKKVKNLSGGEKTRLKLCLLMQQDINTLILDEPTNHLDIDSREMLEDALSNFRGTIIFISHDRYFINKIADRLVELEDKKLINYLGNYDYYKNEKEKRMLSNNINNQVKQKEIKKGHKERASKRKMNVDKQICDLEKEIEHLEKLIEEKDKAMEKYKTDYIKLNEIYNEKQKLKLKFEELIDKWIELND